MDRRLRRTLRIKDNSDATIISRGDSRYDSIDPHHVYKQVIIGATVKPSAGVIRVGNAFYEVHDGDYSPSLHEWSGTTTYGVRWKRTDYTEREIEQAQAQLDKSDKAEMRAAKLRFYRSRLSRFTQG